MNAEATNGFVALRDTMNIFKKALRLPHSAFCLLPLVAAAAHADSAPAFDAAAFGALPAQAGGRVQPLDSLARNTLMLLRQKQTVSFTTSGALMMRNTSEGDFYTKKPSTWTDADKAAFRADGLPYENKDVIAALEKRPVAVKRSGMGDSLDADNWLAEVALRPWIAKHFRVFRIDNEEVQSLIGLPVRNPAQYSWAEIERSIPTLAEAATKAGKKEAGALTPFENGALKLANAIERYHMLANVTFIPGDLPLNVPVDIDPTIEYYNWLETLRGAAVQLEKTKTSDSPGKFDEATLAQFNALRSSYLTFYKEGKIGLVPPRTPGEIRDASWANLGGAMLDVIEGQPLDKPSVYPRYAELAVAYRAGDDTTANTKVRELAAQYTDGVGGYSSAKISGETLFNRTEPFYRGIMIYALAGFAVLAGWIASRRWPLTVAYWLIAAGWLIHTAGLIARMWIQGRPPVTNLYSSAVYVGWLAALLCLVVERVWKNGVATFVAAVVGFATLVIAHQLGANGEDTIEMMRAVLDSNFWLATHVVVVTSGYSAMFVAGFLATLGLALRVSATLRRIARPLILVMGALTAPLVSLAALLSSKRLGAWFAEPLTDEDTDVERTIVRAAYGALCFATLASFVGTMLGGIWADQSWGRFWGWDPKENGALLIVLWCALVLHARLGGVIRKTGFLQLLVVGNIVTAWSWFGTNLLGVGLHSYGFTQSGAFALLLFILSQLVVIALGWLPERRAATAAPAENA